MPALAEYYAELGVHGMPRIMGAFAQVRSGLASLASAATSPIRGIGNMLAGLVSPAGLASAALSAVGVAGMGGILKLASDVESLDTQFRVLLGSGEAAAKMMADINKFAAATPFEQMQLAEAAKQLLAYGTSAENIIPTMRQLGDISALSGARLEDLVGIYGKVQGQGKMTAETLEQFQVRGIPITRELAKQFGVAETEIRGLVASGKVGFPQVQAAIAAMTGEGGQFAGGMEQLSKTTGGLWSTVTGNFKTLLAQFGSAIIKVFDLKSVLAGMGNWLDSLSASFESIAGPLMEWVRTAISATVSAIASVVSTVWPFLKTAFAAIYEIVSSIFTRMSGIIIGIWTALSGWIRRMWAEWGDVVQQYYQTLVAIFMALFDAILSVFKAIWNVVVSVWNSIRDVVASVVGSMGGVLGRFFGSSSGGLKKMVNDWLMSIQFIAENWKLYLAIFWERFKLFIRNLPEYFKAGVQNLVILLQWFGRNWRDIFVTVWRYGTTVFGNLITNLRNLWDAFWRWIKGGAWEFDWTPLTQGFVSAIKEMPKLVEANVERTTPALERLTAELEERRREFYQRKAAEKAEREKAKETAPPAAPEAAKAPAAPAATAPEAAKAPAAPAAAGGVPGTAGGTAGKAGISFVGLAALATQMQEEAGKRLQEQMARASQQTADATGKLAGAVAGNKLRVEVVNSPPAVAQYAP